jgi:hypothetical protein
MALKNKKAMSGCETAHGLKWRQFHSPSVLRHHVLSIFLLFPEVMLVL